MQTVVHVAHHIDPNVLEFLYNSLFTLSGLTGLVVLLNLILRCCGKK